MTTRSSGDVAQSGVTSRAMANAIRALSMDAVQQANSGHPGMPMGMADAATVLFSRFMKFDPAQPNWPDRDRFVLSAGHGSMLLYSLLHLTGYQDMTLEEVKNFRQLGSKTAGHPEYGHASGIETTTGPLGQGIATAVGMALAERLLAKEFGADVVDHHTYVIAGDGCLQEGVSHEAASLAGHWKLGRMIVLWDDNDISIDGDVALANSDNVLKRFESYGWQTLSADGHDEESVATALEAAKADETRPTLIACKTVIGFGAPNKQGTAATHGAPLGDAEIAAAREELNWPYAPFEIPADIQAAWKAVGDKGASDAAAWADRLANLDPAKKAEFERRMAGELPEALTDAFNEVKRAATEERPKVATRKASQMVLDAITAVAPELLGGSADLTGSNLTKAGGQKVVQAPDYDGSYLHYGIREHGMAAAMNGLALHGGFIPYGGTFMVFTDYCRPSIRLAALMKQRAVYVMTHDSIGLGEDGPTHQPVEHLASLRAMPNLNVFRPADLIETAECWELALRSKDTPSVLSLTRQGVPTLRGEGLGENWSAYGGYILRPAAGERQCTLLASGSEVEIAIAAQEKLAAEGIHAAVVSMPCWELFLEQPGHYREEVLGPGLLRVAVEAGHWFGWHRWVGLDGAVVGMKDFGASGPADELYKHFEITPESVVKTVQDWL
ncbi:transketolase [Rhodovibrionaceae bacterium A322]